MASFMDGNPALKGLSGDLKRRMDAAVATFQASLASTRTGRASAHMLDQIKVDYYGTMTPIHQMAQVCTPEPQTDSHSALGPFGPQRDREGYPGFRSRLQSASPTARSFAFRFRP